MVFSRRLCAGLLFHTPWSNTLLSLTAINGAERLGNAGYISSSNSIIMGPITSRKYMTGQTIQEIFHASNRRTLVGILSVRTYCTNAISSSGGVTCDQPDEKFSSSGRENFCDLGKISARNASKLPFLDAFGSPRFVPLCCDPWPSWHFVSTRRPVTCDWWIECIGTVIGAMQLTAGIHETVERYTWGQVSQCIYTVTLWKFPKCTTQHIPTSHFQCVSFSMPLPCSHYSASIIPGPVLIL
jgi:hypothetical protein